MKEVRTAVAVMNSLFCSIGRDRHCEERSDEAIQAGTPAANIDS